MTITTTTLPYDEGRKAWALAQHLRAYNGESMLTLGQCMREEGEGDMETNNPAFMFQTMSTALLEAIACGRLNVIAAAIFELANRGVYVVEAGQQ